MKTWNHRATLALAFATMMTLTACGGGGGGSPTPPGVIPPPAPIDPPPPTDPTPPPASNAGRFAISGIEKIPQDMLKMTNKEMQKKWVISETWPEHGRTVSRVACQSYVTNSPQCERDSWARKTHSTDGTVVIRAGNSPFTELLDLKEIAPGNRPPEYLWIMGEAARMGAKIVTSTSSGNTFVRHDNLPYLVVASAGNGKSDFSWLQDQSEFGGNAADQRYVQRTVRSAVAADKLLFVAGYDKNVAGNYVRHWWSSGCKDSELVNGCLWTRFDFLDVGVGTSLSSPHLSAALASVLAVFPDTTPENLARFAKASAKKTGNGIPALLAQSGGVGVADFNSMGKIISALRDLPAGGSTNLIIDGQSVTMTGRKISMMGSAIRSAALMAPTVDAGMESSYAGVSTPLTLTRTEERDGVSFNFIPTGTDTGMLAATHRKGDFFASAALGTRGDFFGFTNGHGEVKEANIAAGHKNIFAHFGRQWSDNGLSVDSAEGEYVGFTLRKGMRVSENMSLSAAAHATRFLGGEADIHRASVNLGKSGWEHKLSLSTGIALTEDSALSISADALFPETGSEQNVFARYLLRF